MEDTQQKGQDKEGSMAGPGVSRMGKPTRRETGTLVTDREIRVRRWGRGAGRVPQRPHIQKVLHNPKWKKCPDLKINEPCVEQCVEQCWKARIVCWDKE